MLIVSLRLDQSLQEVALDLQNRLCPLPGPERDPLPGPERDPLPGPGRDFNLNPHQGLKVGCAMDLNNCSYFPLRGKNPNKMTKTSFRTDVLIFAFHGESAARSLCQSFQISVCSWLLVLVLAVKWTLDLSEYECKLFRQLTHYRRADCFN